MYPYTPTVSEPPTGILYAGCPVFELFEKKLTYCLYYIYEFITHLVPSWAVIGNEHNWSSHYWARGRLLLLYLLKKPVWLNFVQKFGVKFQTIPNQEVVCNSLSYYTYKISAAKASCLGLMCVRYFESLGMKYSLQLDNIDGNKFPGLSIIFSFWNTFFFSNFVLPKKNIWQNNSRNISKIWKFVML